MRFYVLDSPELEEGQEPHLAVTDFLKSDPVNRGKGFDCPLCGKQMGMLPWLPPYRVELEFWGKEAGDIAFFGASLLVSDRFKGRWEQAGLIGLSGFHPVEIVRTKSCGKRKDIKPPGNYYYVEIARSKAAIDEVASGLVREGKEQPCEECRAARGVIKRTRRIVIEEGTWSGEDIFYLRGLSGTIITSERYREFHISNKINNGLLIPAEEYNFDFYPWENR